MGTGALRVFCFDGFTLDESRAALTRQGREIGLRPKAFAALQYLLVNRGRLVEKAELIRALWPDAFVTDDSLVQCIREIRAALSDEDQLYIKTVHRRGYLFAFEVTQDSVAALQIAPAPPSPGEPITRYARSADLSIAYQVLGNGRFDLVYLPGWVSHLESAWHEPSLAAYYRHLASFCRLILLDMRGTGLSDRSSRMPGLEERIDDILAVMDAAGSERAVIFGASDAGHTAALFAASHPGRAIALITFGTAWAPHPEIDAGVALAPSRSQDDEFQRWWSAYLRRSASPSAARDLAGINALLDTRPILPSIGAPSLILRSEHDLLSGSGESQSAAAQIPGARYLEFPGSDHLPWTGNAQPALDAIHSFLDDLPTGQTAQRFVATLLLMRVQDPGGEASQWESAIRRTLVFFRGRELRYAEGELLASFDGPARAVRAAHSLIAAAAQLHLSGSASVHCGECAWGDQDISGPALKEVIAMAETSVPGEVRVSQTLRDLIAGSEPAFDSPVRGDGTLLFVGRDPELQSLIETAGNAARGSGSVTFICGEPGIGKTALTTEFIQRALACNPDLIVGRGACLEAYGAGEAYLPWLEVIGDLMRGRAQNAVLRILRKHAPTWLLHFPEVFGADASRDSLEKDTIGATQKRMLSELAHAFAELARLRQVVIVIEDLHWADPSSIDFLRYLSEHLHAGRLAIVATVRPDAARQNPPLHAAMLELEAHRLSTTVQVGRLAAGQTQEYLDRRYLQNRFPPQFPESVARRTEGHPLFIVSLLDFLEGRGDVRLHDGWWHLDCPLDEAAARELPENVLSMVRRKLDGLSEVERRTLTLASIQGDEFMASWVAALLDEDLSLVIERLDQIRRTRRLIDFIEPGDSDLDATDGAYRFAHSVYHQVVYEDLTPPVRAHLHLRMGEALFQRHGAGSTQHLPQLSMHFERGGDWTRAVQFAIASGDHSAGIYANAEAMGHFQRALRLSGRLPPADRDLQVPRLHRRLGLAHFAMGQFGNAIEEFEQACRGFTAPESAGERCETLVMLANALFYGHRLDEMAAIAIEALESAQAARNTALELDAMVLLALKHNSYGELDETERLLDRVILEGRQLGHRRALATGLCWRALTHDFHSEYAKADELCVEATALASELRDGYLLLTCLFYQGITLANLGRISVALKTLNDGFELACRNANLSFPPKFANTLGWIYREIGDAGAALHWNQEGLRLSRAVKIKEAETNCLLNLGLDEVQLGARLAESDPLGRAEQIIHGDVWHGWRYNIRLQTGLCYRSLRAGQPGEAAHYADALAQSSRQYGAHKYCAEAEFLRAAVASAKDDDETAIGCLQSARAILRQYPAPLLAWRVERACGQVEARRGQRECSAAAFEAASAITSAIADSISDERLRSSFVSLTVAEGRA